MTKITKTLTGHGFIFRKGRKLNRTLKYEVAQISLQTSPFPIFRVSRAGFPDV